MSWRDLVEAAPQLMLYPWTGGAVLRVFDGRRWRIRGRLPPEPGWWLFEVAAVDALFLGPSPEGLPLPRTKAELSGYLVGDRLIPDSSGVTSLTWRSERVHLVPAGMDLFARVRGARFFEDGPLIFNGLEMPLGPEADVLEAYLDRSERLNHVRGVPPALEYAFDVATERRHCVEQRRARAAQEAAEREAARAQEEARQELVQRLGDGAGRRAMARVDFDAAAAAALAVGGATLLDSRKSEQPGERVVRFRLDGRRFECTCCAESLQIIDSGICLTAHDSEEFSDGTKGDSWFTLESLPSVIREATRTGVLHVYRHA